MAEVEVRGADAFYKVSKQLKAQGRGELRKELNRGIRQVARPLAMRGREAVAAETPATGGLARAVRKQPVGVKTQTGMQTAGVRLTFGRKGGVLRGLNSGVFRHPVFATELPWRGAWVSQQVPTAEGAWEESIEGDKRLVQAAIADVMSDVLRRLGRG